MEKIHQLFKQYMDNNEEWNKLHTVTARNSSIEEWTNQLVQSLERMEKIYNSNNEIIDDIDELMNNGLNESFVQEITDEVMKLYYEEYYDFEFVKDIFERLIGYYEETLDVTDYQDERLERLIDLYYCAQTNLLDLGNLLCVGKRCDFKYLDKALAYMEHYFSMTPKARYRLLLFHYNNIVVFLDRGMCTTKQATERFKEFKRFTGQKEFQELEKDYEENLAIVKMIEEHFIYSVIRFDEFDDETRSYFREYLLEYFSKHKVDRKSDYELSVPEYASYLMLYFLDEKYTLAELFDMFTGYFEYHFLSNIHQRNMEQNDFVDSANCIAIMTNTVKYLDDMERKTKLTELFLNFAQSKFINGQGINYRKINEILAGVCHYILKLDVPGVDKTKCLYQMVIQRNMPVYLHGKITSEIAVAIYRELMIFNPHYFNEIKEISKHGIKDFIHYSAMFHDIGRTEMFTSASVQFRRPYKEEIERRKHHTIVGQEAFSDIEELKRYQDIVAGHHGYYDGSDDKELYQQIKNSNYKCVVYIIAIASAIEEATNNLFDVSGEVVSFSAFFETMKAERGKRFSPELVDLFVNSPALQKTVTDIVTTKRLQEMYQVSHNWHKIQLAVDDRSILNEIEQKLEFYKSKNDEENIAVYLDKLIHLTKIAEDKEVRGEALYILIRFYLDRGDFYAAVTLETITTKLLEETKNYELLMRTNMDYGIVEYIRENYEMSLSKFLYAIEMAKRLPECENELIYCYVYISNIYCTIDHYELALVYLKRGEELVEYGDPVHLNLCCMKGYCSIKIGDLEEVKRDRDIIVEYAPKYPNLSQFAVKTYLACFENALGNHEKCMEYLEQLENDMIEERHILYFSDAVTYYIELLSELELYDRLIEPLEVCINYCKDKNEAYDFYVFLLKKRIECAKNLGERGVYENYGQLLFKAIDDSKKQRAVRMEKLEKAYSEYFALQAASNEMLLDKKELEESIKVAKNESAMKSQFLSSMSHEIRTPINAILGLNEMILRESSENEILQYASDIQNAGKQLLGIVNDILDYSKIEAGKMNLVSERYEVGEMISEIKQMIEPKTREKNLNFTVTYDRKIPRALLGDDLRMKQILINLLSNAYKYTREGSIGLSVSYEKVDEKSISIQFSVTDTGIGLKPDQIKKLALPFERFEHVKNRGIEGTGLGMSIVTRLLKQMNSQLVIESEYGKGSTFSFAIVQEVVDWNTIGDACLRSKNRDEEQGKFSDKLSGTKEEMQGQQGEKKSAAGLFTAPSAEILVVDDNMVNLKVAKALLRRTGVNVTTASSGKECLELCKEKPFHVIFLDHMMPEMDGLETLSRIKEQNGENRNTPVIALTANAMEGGDEFYQKAGFDALLVKPINFDDLEAKLMYFLPKELVQVKE